MSERKKRPSDLQKQINFRVTDEEAAKISANAARVGLTVTQYAKRAALRQKVQAPAAPPEVMREVLGQLGHIGANINQIARAANAGDGVAVDAVRDVKKDFTALWDCIVEGKKPKEHEAQPSPVPDVVERSEPDKPPQVAQSAKIAERQEEQKPPEVCEKCGEPLREWEGKAGRFKSCPNHHAKGDGHTIYRVE